MEKKGVSPVIATILLISIVIIVGVIIFLWARGFISEKAEKFDRDVSLSCEDVNFEAGVVSSGGYILDIINRGNIPIYGFDVKILGEGEVLVNEIIGNTIGLGESVDISLSGIGGLSSGDELNVVPIILGSSDTGKVAHTCEDRWGFVTAVP